MKIVMDGVDLYKSAELLTSKSLKDLKESDIIEIMGLHSIMKVRDNVPQVHKTLTDLALNARIGLNELNHEPIEEDIQLLMVNTIKINNAYKILMN